VKAGLPTEAASRQFSFWPTDSHVLLIRLLHSEPGHKGRLIRLRPRDSSPTVQRTDVGGPGVLPIPGPFPRHFAGRVNVPLECANSDRPEVRFAFLAAARLRQEVEAAA
jgi:hypothetical protein